MKRALFIVVCLWVYHIQSQELITNGSFENFTGGLPENWIQEQGTHEEEITVVSHGLKSVKVTPQAPGTGMSTVSRINQVFTLSSTDSYTLQFDYFIPGNDQTNDVQTLQYLLTNMQPSNAVFNHPGNVLVGGTLVYNGWTTVTYQLQVDSFRNGATSANIKLSFSVTGKGEGKNETVYIDKVSIVPSSTLDIVDISTDYTIVTAIDSENIHLSRQYYVRDFKLFSMDGKIIDKGKIEEALIDISLLNRGIYVVTLKTDTNTYAKKFVKY